MIGGDLEKTIDDSKLSTLEFALEIQPLINDREKCEDFIREKKKQMIDATDSVLMFILLQTAGIIYRILRLQMIT